MLSRATWRCILFALAVALVAGGAIAAETAPAPIPWTPVGLGGGGGMYRPAISPHDPGLMFVSCDMGGFYRTADAGKSWTMLSFRQIQANCDCRPVFHPTDPNTVFAADGYDISRLLVSCDKGVTWTPMLTNAPWGSSHVTALGIDRVDGATMLIGAANSVYLSADAGKTWTRCDGPAGQVTGFHVVKSTGPSRAIVAAGRQGIWLSKDSGKTWQAAGKGLPWFDVVDLAGGEDAATGKTVLFVTIPSKAVNGKFAGGIYRSEDLGRSWQSAMGAGTNTSLGKADEYAESDIPQYHWLAMPPDQTNLVYASNNGTGLRPPYHDTVYVSRDSGKTWKYCFTGDLRWEGHNVEPGWHEFDIMWDERDSGLACDATGKIVAQTGGKFFRTENGGESWREVYTMRAPGQGAPARGQKWHTIGLGVTTTWDYVIDPTDANRHYICYTDIGFARSLDAGKTWILSRKGSPWPNTCYGIVCDPARPGLIYGAWSNVHDIPHPTYSEGSRRKGEGGVCVSTDYGATWTPSNEGLPLGPVTSIVMDPASPPDARVLYVADCGYGIYKSTDGGKHWTKKSVGLGVHGNMSTYSVARHPDGTLYCSIIVSRTGQELPTADAGLYMSTDGAETWTKVSASLELGYPTGFAVDPTDRNTIYLCASNWGPCTTGGLYKTTDGGRTWKWIFNKQSPAYEGRGIESYFVTFGKDDPKKLYYATGPQGLMFSPDAGATWTPFLGLPFPEVHRVTFDLAQPGAIYVTTFGGDVWHGPDNPAAE